MEDTSMDEQDQELHMEQDWSHQWSAQQDSNMLGQSALPPLYSLHSFPEHGQSEEQSASMITDNRRLYQDLDQDAVKTNPPCILSGDHSISAHRHEQDVDMLEIQPPSPLYAYHSPNAQEDEKNIDPAAQDTTTQSLWPYNQDSGSASTEYAIELDFNIEAHAIQEHVHYAIECVTTTAELPTSLHPFEQSIRDAREDLEDLTPQSYQCLLKIQTSMFATSTKRFREGAAPYTDEELREQAAVMGSVEFPDAETEKQYLRRLEAQLALFKGHEQMLRSGPRRNDSGMPPPKNRHRVPSRGQISGRDRMDLD